MQTILETKSLNLYYGKQRALKDISLSIEEREVTAFIGPSGCGKSSYLRVFNRMNDLIADCHIEGSALFKGNNIWR